MTLPLSAPGTIGAALLVFIPTVGDYVTPTLVGGSERHHDRHADPGAVLARTMRRSAPPSQSS